jgi:hypothetical protein
MDFKVGFKPKLFSTFVKDSDKLNLWCSGSGIVYAIRFDIHCFYKGQDLIGMPILVFLKMLNKEPYRVEIIWVPTKDDNHGQNQHVYDFDINRSGSKGLTNLDLEKKNCLHLGL